MSLCIRRLNAAPRDSGGSYGQYEETHSNAGMGSLRLSFHLPFSLGRSNRPHHSK